MLHLRSGGLLLEKDSARWQRRLRREQCGVYAAHVQQWAISHNGQRCCPSSFDLQRRITAVHDQAQRFRIWATGACYDRRSLQPARFNDKPEMRLWCDMRIAGNDRLWVERTLRLFS
jgi:hypothetical protein